MARSTWKFNFFNKFVSKFFFINLFKVFKIKKLFCRNSSIPKIFYKKVMFLHKGNTFNRILFNRFCFSYKVGEFSFTRKPFHFPQKKVKSKKKR